MADHPSAVLPQVSVIIVTYNAVDRVRRCVEAVLRATLAPLEVIVVDNGSDDGTVAELRTLFGAAIEVIDLGENRGPAAARNEGVARASAPYLCFLDNDTVPHANWLEAPVRLMEEDLTLGACQSKLLLLDDPESFDYAGDYLSPLGFLIQRVQAGERDAGQADSREEIFSAKSAGMVMRTEAFLKAGGFDPDYFIYVEETDLAWRVWLCGYRIVFEPESVVLHEFGTSAVVLGELQNRLLKYHGTRNYLTTIFKCAGSFSLPPMFFLNATGWLGIAAWLATKGCFKDSMNILLGMGAFVRQFPQNLRKRRAVQQSRQLTDRALYPRIRRRRHFSYFYGKLAVRHRIGNAESFYRGRASKIRETT